MTRDDPAAFAPPPAFGPFRVLHQIGIGALGPVFRTYEPTRDRLVAVKVFRLDITPEQAQALADELTRAAEAGLFHPSIVEPIAAGVEGTVAYRAEEYVAAESLDVAMRHYAPAALDKALPFITQLAGAIDFARTAGVGHGALHLRDIFVTPDEARASGFGVVEALERVGLRAPVRRPYSAPERIAGRPWSTPADVFSLGAIAYELLTGRRPSGTGEQIGALHGRRRRRACRGDPRGPRARDGRRPGAALSDRARVRGGARGRGARRARVRRRVDDGRAAAAIATPRRWPRSQRRRRARASPRRCPTRDEAASMSTPRPAKTTTRTRIATPSATRTRPITICRAAEAEDDADAAVFDDEAAADLALDAPDTSTTSSTSPSSIEPSAGGRGRPTSWQMTADDDDETGGALPNPASWRPIGASSAPRGVRVDRRGRTAR